MSDMERQRFQVCEDTPPIFSSHSFRSQALIFSIHHVFTPQHLRIFDHVLFFGSVADMEGVTYACMQKIYEVVRFCACVDACT